MKKLLLLLVTSSLLTACSQSTSTYEVSCKDQLSPAEKANADIVVKEMEDTITYFLGTKIRTDSTVSRACYIKSCESFATRSYYELFPAGYNSPVGQTIYAIDTGSMNPTSRIVCVPKKSCASLELGPSTADLPFSWNLDNIFYDPNTETDDGTHTVYDAVEYNTSVCSSSESCLEEELPPYAISGMRVFNEEIGENICVATACADGYVVLGPICVPDIPEGCEEGFVDNGEECVPVEISCTEEELSGIGAATGHKVFNTMTNEYDLCQADTCIEGYSLGLGICNPDEVGGGDVYGCMDSRAANYNPSATVEDMSCVCGPGQMPWNPITGCEDMP